MKTLIGENLNFDWKIISITIISTLLLMMDYYHHFTSYKYWDRVILYLVVPLLVIIIFFRENPKEFGFSLGDWKAGLLIAAMGVLIMAPTVYYLGSRNMSLQNFYKSYPNDLPWNIFLDLIGWEFLFRGWMLFGYARKFGPEALWIQAVPFALMHNGKPELETLSTIFGGFAFGWVAYRTKSFVWPFLIHWFIATFVVIVAEGLT